MIKNKYSFLIVFIVIVSLGFIYSFKYSSDMKNLDKSIIEIYNGAPFDENNWIAQNPPKKTSDEWYDANYSKDSYIVYINKNKIHITKGEKEYNIHYKIDEGYFYAANFGEYGGYLNFVPDNFIKYKVLNGNINNIFNYKENIYALEGLGHLGLNEGQIILLEKKYRPLSIGKKWSSTKILDLNDAPKTYTISENNDLFVITNNNLLVIKNMEQINYIIKEAFWSGLYPTSAIIQNDILYIGMRGGIAKVNLEDNNIVWLTKKAD